jgi:hypothetical protein
MSKRLSLAAGLCVFAATALRAAPPTEYGVYELHFQPSFQLTGKSHADLIPLRVGLGHYLSPASQVGGYMTLSKKDNGSYWGTSDVWGLGVFGETALTWDRPLYPYLGLSMGLLDGDGDNSTAFAASVSPGVKTFLMETVAFSLQFDWNLSNRPIYDFKRDYSFPNSVEGKGDKTSLALTLAVRVLFY